MERCAEPRDPLLPKTTTTRGLNVAHTQALGNLFPSQKLKGSHTFTASSTTLESNEAEEDSDVNPEEAESSAGDDAEASLELEEKTSVSWVCCPFYVVKLY